MFLRTVKMLKATSHAKSEIKTRPGSLLTGRVFIFDFIQRQPYICRHFSVCKWAWQNSLGACEWAWQFILHSVSDTVPVSCRTPF